MRHSAGILIYRRAPELEVFLVHPGGPFWARKDVWGVPKGEYYDVEEPLTAAKREFEEEIGQPVPAGEAIDLGEIKTSNKIIKVWALEGEVDAGKVRSNTVKIEWPPRSGRQLEVPEVDKAAWFKPAAAVAKMHKHQDAFIERLCQKLEVPLEPESLTSQGSLF